MLARHAQQNASYITLVNRCATVALPRLIATSPLHASPHFRTRRFPEPTLGAYFPLEPQIAHRPRWTVGVAEEPVTFRVFPYPKDRAN